MAFPDIILALHHAFAIPDKAQGSPEQNITFYLKLIKIFVQVDPGHQGPIIAREGGPSSIWPIPGWVSGHDYCADFHVAGLGWS